MAQTNKAIAINFLHHVNSKEIGEAQTAFNRLQNLQARQYAQTLITEHQQSEQRLFQLAEQEDVVILVYQPATRETAAEVQLSTLQGNDYDRAFLQLQQQGHQQALQNLQIMAGTVTDSEVQTLIADTITLIQRHLTQATGTQIP